jgi:hypothetical protein
VTTVAARISHRLLEQRIRNRVLDALLLLADGEATVRGWGFAEYFEKFYDWFPCESPWDPPSTMTAEEIAATRSVLALMNNALSATPKIMPDEEFVRSGWPERITPMAREAASVFLARGRFDEETEEDEPSWR